MAKPPVEKAGPLRVSDELRGLLFMFVYGLLTGAFLMWLLL
jgi:hypothetical protein